MTSTTAPAPSTPVLVQVGLVAWLVSAMVVMFTMSNYQPGVGASGPGGGIGFAMLGMYFLACSISFRDFFLYRMKVARAVRWYGEDFTHVAYGGLGAVMVAAGIYMTLTL